MMLILIKKSAFSTPSVASVKTTSTLTCSTIPPKSYLKNLITVPNPDAVDPIDALVQVKISLTTLVSELSLTPLITLVVVSIPVFANVIITA